MADKSSSSTTSLMNNARCPSGSHSRMFCGSSNNWSGWYSRNVLSMLAIIGIFAGRQSLFSDRLLAVRAVNIFQEFVGHRGGVSAAVAGLLQHDGEDHLRAGLQHIADEPG